MYIIKNAIFIDNSFSNNFWVDAINITNYLQNQLLTSYTSYSKITIIGMRIDLKKTKSQLY